MANKRMSLRSSATFTIVSSVILGAGASMPTVGGAADNGSSADSGGGLEEVVVMARKRVEPLQSTPVAATVLGGEKLELGFVNALTSLSAPAPNVKITQMDFWSNSASVAIRGITNTDIESTLDPPIAIFIDGVYIPRAAGSNMDLFDVEQIEILRGPQGTLFGRNTTGGAVQVRTRRPSGEFGVRGLVKVGDYGRTDIKAAFDVPIIDGKIAGKLAVLSQNSDGYFRSTFTGRDLGGENILGLRPMLQFTPNDDFDITFIGEYNRNKSDVWPGQNESDSSKLLCSLHNYCGFPLGQGSEYNVPLSDAGEFDIEIWGLTVEANWDIGLGTITSVSNYRDTEEFVTLNGDMVEATMFELTRDQPHSQYSTELRFASNTDGRLDYIVGAYYFHQKYEMIQRNFLTIVPNTPTQDLTRRAVQKHDSYSVFGEANWRFSDRWTATLGGRYSNDRKDFDPELFGLGEIGPAVDVPSKSWSDFGPKAGLQFQISPEIMTYATYSRGFKSGGFNGRCGQEVTCRLSFDPEEVDGYEIGTKSQFFDNRLRMNLALFWSEYENLQQTLIVPLPGAADPSETVTANAASARIRGVELEMIAMLMPNLRFDFNVGYLDSSYSKFCADLDGPEPSTVFPTSPCGNVVAVGDLANDGIPDYLVDQDHSNLSLAQAPKWNYSANLNYEIPLPAGYMVLDGRYSYSEKLFTDYRELSPRDSVGLFDASISYRDADDRYRISLYGQNLTDETYTTARNLAAQLWTTRFVNPPRTWGLEVSFTL